MNKSKKTVLYFGSYDPDYSRNRIIKKGLEANGIKVLEDRASGLIFARYFKLLVTFLMLQKQFKTIIIGFPGHYDVPLAYVLGKVFGKKVFLDIFASTYETYVLDRAVVKKKSISARFFFFLDWLGIKLADHVLVDTKSHGKFYWDIYGLEPKKQILVYVGSDPDYFYPKKLKEQTDVLFYGSYQPLQGTDVIIKAAAKLPKFKFKMIGEGQERKSAEDLVKNLKLKNVEFINWLPVSKLSEEISKAKICLGIFGRGSKADAVIPNKVYDAIASKKVIITADTPAAREILTNGINAILLPPDPEYLARAIELILSDKGKRYSLSEKAYSLYISNYIPKLVVKSLIAAIDK